MEQQTQRFEGRVVYQLYPGVKGLLFQTVAFKILRVQPTEPGPEITVKGDIGDWDPEDLFEFYGEFYSDPKYPNGLNFKALQIQNLIPTSVTGIENFLARKVKGVGKGRAAKLVKFFGGTMISVLDNNPERLIECPGISEGVAKTIATSWSADHNPLLRQVGLFLAQYGIGDTWADKFVKQFGSKTIEFIKVNPYRSMAIAGIGFRKADDFANRMGWPEQCPERTESAFRLAIIESLSNGHTFMHHADLIAQVRKIATSRKGESDTDKQLPVELAETALERVLLRNELIREEVKINQHPWVFYYLPHLQKAEKRLAKRIAELDSMVHIAPHNIEEILDRVQDDLKTPLSPEQREGAIASLKNNLFILTGGPGTGKTTTTRAILKAAERLGLSVRLCAPTGRAAKRMSEVTGYEAETIHKLLEYNPNEAEDPSGFCRDAHNPIECDLLLVDESSMLDLELADSLFNAVPNSCSVVLIGDVDQLPAVGPGMVLRDLINSKRVATTKLETIFRQAADSLIIRNAHSIRRGETPNLPTKKNGLSLLECKEDSYLIEMTQTRNKDDNRYVDDIDAVKGWLPKIIKTLQQRDPKIDPIRDIQVLCPMKKGMAGTPEFNNVLQRALNPSDEEITVKGQKFRVGDRVMQLRNNYEPHMGISNGEIGFIQSFDIAQEEIIIDFDTKLDVHYKFKDVDELILAYACTIHKSQGSEFPILIMILSSSYHWSMLERNLIYTGNTRAKQMVVWIGTWKAIARAVETNNVNQRNSFLAHRIRKMVPEQVIMPLIAAASAPVIEDEEPCLA